MFQPLAAQALSIRAGWFGGVNRDDAASRRLFVGAEPEDRTVVADEVVRGLELVDQLDDLVVRPLATARGTVPQVFVKNQILRVGSLPDADDQITPVFGDLTVESPLLLVFALVNQNVFGLRRAEAMIKSFW